MSYSETVLVKLNELCIQNNINLFEAASHYCDINDIDPEDFFEEIDPAARDQIKLAAIEGRHVRKSFRGKAAKLL